MTSPHLVIVGHTAADVLELGSTPSETTYVAGGGVYYGALAAAAAVPGIKVTASTITRKDIWEKYFEHDFTSHGISTLNTPSSTQTIFHNVLADPTNPDSRVSRVLGLAPAFSAAPKLGQDATMFTPLSCGEVPNSVLESCPGLVVFDVQGLIRHIAPDGAVSHKLENGLPKLPVDILKVDQAEITHILGRAPEDYAADVRESVLPKLRENAKVIVTNFDGVRVVSENEFVFAPFGACNPKYRTGRGDTVTATFTAALVKGLSTEEAAKLAAHAATVKMNHPGPLKSL